MPEIGTSLREARMRAKTDISEVEAETKIRAKYLRAIENEDWALLPGPAYVKSFLRTYADYLGLDGKLLVEEYKLHHEQPSALDTAPINATLTERRRLPAPPRVPRGLVVGGSVVGLIVLLIVLGSVGGGDSGTAPTPTVTTQPPRKKTPARTPAAAAPAKQPADRVRLELTPSAPVWVCLVDAADKPLIDGQVLQPGGTSPRQAFESKSFKITLGNGHVSLTVNGKALDVPQRPDPVGFELTPSSQTELPESRRPLCQ